jgi:Sec-independent protein translocase protein TatA
VGFGTELLFLLVLGFLLFGPKKLPAIFGKLGRAKAQPRHATDALISQLDMVREPESQRPEMNLQARTGERQ